MLGIEGEAPASYNSLNDTNYLEQLVEGDADILLAYAELDKLDNLGLAYIPLIRSPFVAMVSMDSPLASMKSVTMDDLRSYRFVKFADGYSLSGWTNIERVCQEHGYTPRTRAVLGRTYMNYCAIPLGVEDVMILQASMPQLRYLSDFSRVTVLPVTDDDAPSGCTPSTRRTTTNACGRPWTLTPAPARSSSTMAKAAPWSTASSRAQGKAALNGQIPNASCKFEELEATFWSIIGR